jgi:hypothetical protein
VESETKSTMPFIIALEKKMKYLGRNLTKHVGNLYAEKISKYQ